MKLCTACSAQLPDEHVRCLHCGRRLRPASVLADEGTESYTHLADESAAKVSPLLDRLADSDIDFRLEMDTRASRDRLGQDANHPRATVYVANADLGRARVLYRSFLEDLMPHLERLGRSHGSDDRCPACEAALDPEASGCPSCGIEFPSE